eukprot:515948-Prymnesium_polylepis.1
MRAVVDSSQIIVSVVARGARPTANLNRVSEDLLSRRFQSHSGLRIVRPRFLWLLRQGSPSCRARSQPRRILAARGVEGCRVLGAKMCGRARIAMRDVRGGGVRCSGSQRKGLKCDGQHSAQSRGRGGGGGMPRGAFVHVR